MIEAEWWEYDSVEEMADAVAGDVGFIVESALEARDSALIALPTIVLAAWSYSRLSSKWTLVAAILLTLAGLAVLIYGFHMLHRSRYGRGLLAIGRDETVAKTMGIPTTRVKLYAYAIGVLIGNLQPGLAVGDSVQIVRVGLEAQLQA